MAISIQPLADLLINAIHNLDNADDAQSIIASKINGYLNQNLTVQGIYTGTIPGSPPVTDPLNGAYLWSVSSCQLTGNELKNAARNNGVPGWMQYIKGKIQIMISGTADITDSIKTTPITFGSLNMPYNYSNSGNYQDSMTRIATAVVNGILSATPSGGGSATSTSGGVGNVVLGSFL